VLPTAYWSWALVGAALTLVYAIGRHDAVFVLGALVTGVLFARNAFLERRPGAGERGTEPTSEPALWPVLVGCLLFALLVAVDAALSPSLLREETSRVWTAVGWAGQALWTGRVVVQWVVSERHGRSVLPEGFFSLGFLGSVLLTGYALAQQDWVNVAAQAFNPFFYGRNWLLARRSLTAPPA
jgi:lipid-A-disaccharide synthase-like uncharacterized protein